MANFKYRIIKRITISAAKHANPQADTSKLEEEIDIAEGKE